MKEIEAEERKIHAQLDRLGSYYLEDSRLRQQVVKALVKKLSVVELGQLDTLLGSIDPDKE